MPAIFTIIAVVTLLHSKRSSPPSPTFALHLAMKIYRFKQHSLKNDPFKEKRPVALDQSSLLTILLTQTLLLLKELLLQLLLCLLADNSCGSLQRLLMQSQGFL